ncbi:MAG: polysaccharide pyruvyl transferase family protein [Minisyncoccia bacterium]
MNNPLVSVIIPTKNSSQFLEACLLSIKNQTYKNIEIIVVDNNSTDNTKEIAKKYTDKVFNKGPERSAQVNYGVTQALGEYVYKIDSDFVLDTEVVEQCVSKTMEGYDAVVVHNSPDVRVSWIAKIRKFEVDMYKYDITHSSARFVRKEVYEQIGGFNSAITAGEDYDFQNKLNRGNFKTGFIDAEALHLGEPTNFLKHMGKYYDYGKDFVNYKKENEEESKEQLSFGRFVYMKNWKKFIKQPFMGTAFIFYNFFKYGFGGAGFLSGKVGLKCEEVRILLIGTHGQNNIGDELLLETFLFQLRKINKSVFYVNSYHPEQTAKDFNVATFHTLKDKKILLKYIFCSDYIFFAGGSIIKEMYSDYGRSTYSVMNMLMLLICFSKKIAQKKIILSNIGIGPISTKCGFKKAGFIIKNSDVISVRDSISKSYGEKACPAAKIMIVPDAVFSLDRSYFGLGQKGERKISNVAEINTITFNLCRNISRPSVWEQFIDELVTTFAMIYRINPNVKIIGLPMQFDYSCDDNETLQLFNKKLIERVPKIDFKITSPRSSKEVVEIIDSSDLLIAERLHCAILATIVSTPFISLEYDIKVKSYLADIKLEENGIDISEDFSAKEVFKKIEAVAADYYLQKVYLHSISKAKNLLVNEYFAELRSVISSKK